MRKRKIKPPKEPKTFDHPRMYYQAGSAKGSRSLIHTTHRIRIIWPNGKTRWLPLHPRYASGSFQEWDEPCWAGSWSLGKRSYSGAFQLQEMREYDMTHDFKRAIFLGEL